MGNFSNYWDLHTLFTKIKNKLKSISDKIDDSVSLKTATGNPITLTDAANANAEELLMTIEPMQSGSGDPSPTNVRPISGLTSGEVTRTGNNLFGNFELNKSISSETGENLDDVGGFRTAGKIRTAGYNAISLTFLDSTYKGSFIVLQYSDSGYIGVVEEIQCAQIQYPYNRTLTLNEQTTYIRIKGWYGTNVSSINTAQFQVTLGTTPTAYEPYTATNATITFGQTVYGGSVNFKTGEVTVTHGYSKITSSDEIIKSNAPGIQSGRAGYWLGNKTSWLAEIKFSGGDTNPNNISMLSNCYDIGTTSAVQAVVANNFTVGIGQASGASNTVTNLWFNVSATDCPDIQSFINWITSINFEVVYPLATPTTLSLTPAELELLKGNNTITANGAEISIEYYPDNAIGALAERVDDKADKEDVDAKIGDLSQTGFTGDSVSGQLATAKGQIAAKAGNYSSSYTDFNNFPHGSIVQAYGSAAHAPGSASHYYIVFTYYIANTTTYKLQLAIENGSGKVYTRDCTNGTWGDWNIVLTDTNTGLSDVTKLGYLNNVTSDVQTQINGKVGAWILADSTSIDVSSQKMTVMEGLGILNKNEVFVEAGSSQEPERYFHFYFIPKPIYNNMGKVMYYYDPVYEYYITLTFSGNGDIILTTPDMGPNTLLVKVYYR